MPQPSSSSQTTAVIGKSVAVILLLLASFYAGRFGLAEWYVRGAKDRFEYVLADDKASGSTSNLLIAIDLVNKALTLHPNFPDYLNLKAKLLIKQGDLNVDTRSDNYRDALDNLRVSAKVRPMWPDTWVDIIFIKWSLGEHDEELRRAVVSADTVGPWHQYVHQALVFYGLELMRKNPYEIPSFLQRHIVRGLEHPGSRRQVSQFVKASNSKTQACRWVNQELKQRTSASLENGRDLLCR